MKKPLVKIGDGTVIMLFDKAKKEIYCPKFWECKPFNGCGFDCQWCYLNGTYRMKKDKDKLPIGKKPTFKEPKKVNKHVRRAMEEIEEPTMFNCGEVSDGLLFPWMLQQNVIPAFKEWQEKRGHRALILTKSKDISCLFTLKAQDCVTVAFSVNADFVAGQWELGAPDPIVRLQYAQKVSDWGYPVRLRIDPMVPVENYEEGYEELVNRIMKYTPNAEVITLGSLRMTKTNLRVCEDLEKDTSYKEYLDEETSRDWRSKESTRIEMYSFVINSLRDKGYKGHISLCKETESVWEEMSKSLLPDKENAVCNCMMMPDDECPGLSGTPPEEGSDESES